MRKILRLALCLMLIMAVVAEPFVASAKTVQLLECKVKGARVHTGPGGSYPLEGASLRKGEHVLYMKTSGAFCKILTADGRTGYVYKKYLKQYGAIRSNQVYATKSKTKIYSRASKKAESITVWKGTVLFQYLTNNGWAYVKNLYGKSAYIPTSKIKRLY